MIEFPDVIIRLLELICFIYALRYWIIVVGKLYIKEHISSTMIWYTAIFTGLFLDLAGVIA